MNAPRLYKGRAWDLFESLVNGTFREDCSDSDESGIMKSFVKKHSDFSEGKQKTGGTIEVCLKKISISPHLIIFSQLLKSTTSISYSYSPVWFTQFIFYFSSVL